MPQRCGHDERFGGVFGAVEGCLACELEKTQRELREERAANERALDQRSQAMLYLIRRWTVARRVSGDAIMPSQLCELLSLEVTGHIGQQLALFADALRRQGE